MVISTMVVRCCEKPGRGASVFRRNVAAWRSVDEVLAISGVADFDLAALNLDRQGLVAQ
jgi:hypothetical protein